MPSIYKQDIIINSQTMKNFEEITITESTQQSENLSSANSTSKNYNYWQLQLENNNNNPVLTISKQPSASVESAENSAKKELEAILKSYSGATVKISLDALSIGKTEILDWAIFLQKNNLLIKLIFEDGELYQQIFQDLYKNILFSKPNEDSDLKNIIYKKAKQNKVRLSKFTLLAHLKDQEEGGKKIEAKGRKIKPRMQVQRHVQQQQQKKQQNQAEMRAKQIEAQLQRLKKAEKLALQGIEKEDFVNEENFGERFKQYEAKFQEILGGNVQFSDIKKIWDDLVGKDNSLVSDINNKITDVPINTFLKVVKHHSQFTYGVDQDNLSDGFKLLECGKKSILLFDQNFIQKDNNNPDALLAPKLEENKQIKYPPISIGRFFPFHKYSSVKNLKEEYKEFCLINEDTFRKVFDNDLYTASRCFFEIYELVQSNLGQKENNQIDIKALIEKAFQHEGFLSQERMNQIVEKLRWIFLDYGPRGVSSFLNQLKNINEQKLFTKEFSSFLNDSQDWREFMDENTGEVRQELKAFCAISLSEQNWWNSLLSQHYQAKSTMNFWHLFHAHQYFFARIKKLDPYLFENWPTTCPFKDVKHMQVFYSRLLTIFNNAVDPREQLQNLSIEATGETKTLDLGPQGAILAARMRKKIKENNIEREINYYSLITPEMELQPKNGEPISFSISIKDLVDEASKTKKFDSLKKYFFRLIGTDQWTFSPYSIYKELVSIIDRKMNYKFGYGDDSESMKKCLLPIIAVATIGQRAVEDGANKNIIIDDFDKLITLIIKSDKKQIIVLIKQLAKCIGNTDLPIKPTLFDIRNLLNLFDTNDFDADKIEKLMSRFFEVIKIGGENIYQVIDNISLQKQKFKNYKFTVSELEKLIMAAERANEIKDFSNKNIYLLLLSLVDIKTWVKQENLKDYIDQIIAKFNSITSKDLKRHILQLLKTANVTKSGALTSLEGLKTFVSALVDDDKNLQTGDQKHKSDEKYLHELVFIRAKSSLPGIRFDDDVAQGIDESFWVLFDGMAKIIEELPSFRDKITFSYEVKKIFQGLKLGRHSEDGFNSWGQEFLHVIDNISSQEQKFNDYNFKDIDREQFTIAAEVAKNLKKDSLGIYFLLLSLIDIKTWAKQKNIKNNAEKIVEKLNSINFSEYLSNFSRFFDLKEFTLRLLQRANVKESKVLFSSLEQILEVVTKLAEKAKEGIKEYDEKDIISILQQTPLNIHFNDYANGLPPIPKSATFQEIVEEGLNSIDVKKGCDFVGYEIWNRKVLKITEEEEERLELKEEQKESLEQNQKQESSNNQLGNLQSWLRYKGSNSKQEENKGLEKIEIIVPETKPLSLSNLTTKQNMLLFYQDNGKQDILYIDIKNKTGVLLQGSENNLMKDLWKTQKGLLGIDTWSWWSWKDLENIKSINKQNKNVNLSFSQSDQNLNDNKQALEDILYRYYFARTQTASAKFKQGAKKLVDRAKAFVTDTYNVGKDPVTTLASRLIEKEKLVKENICKILFDIYEPIGKSKKILQKAQDQLPYASNDEEKNKLIEKMIEQCVNQAKDAYNRVTKYVATQKGLNNTIDKIVPLKGLERGLRPFIPIVISGILSFLSMYLEKVIQDWSDEYSGAAAFYMAGTKELLQDIKKILLEITLLNLVTIRLDKILASILKAVKKQYLCMLKVLISENLNSRMIEVLIRGLDLPKEPNGQQNKLGEKLCEYCGFGMGVPDFTDFDDVVPGIKKLLHGNEEQKIFLKALKKSFRSPGIRLAFLEALDEKGYFVTNGKKASILSFQDLAAILVNLEKIQLSEYEYIKIFGLIPQATSKDIINALPEIVENKSLFCNSVDLKDKARSLKEFTSLMEVGFKNASAVSILIEVKKAFQDIECTASYKNKAFAAILECFLNADTNKINLDPSKINNADLLKRLKDKFTSFSQKKPTLLGFVNLMFFIFAEQEPKQALGDLEKLLNLLDDNKDLQELIIPIGASLSRDYDLSTIANLKEILKRKFAIQSKKFEEKGELDKLAKLKARHEEKIKEIDEKLAAKKEFMGHLIELVKVVKNKYKEKAEATLSSLKVLYDCHKNPDFKDLKGKLTKDGFDIEKYMYDYERDPFNKRSEILQRWYELVNPKSKTIDKFLDNIEDLSENPPSSLKLQEKKDLKEQLYYVLDLCGPYCKTQITGENKLKTLSDFSHQELMQAFQSYKEKIQDNVKKGIKDLEIQRKCLAVLCEVMFRTTGKYPYHSQMISLLNLINNNDKSLVMQIETSEGKSITSAISAVMQWVKGMHVDVLSANIMLSKRDYDEFKPFFDYLNIDHAFVEATTTENFYTKPRITFSAPDAISLYRSYLEYFKHKLPDKSKTYCIRDEFDRGEFDDVNTDFNFSSSDEDLENNPYEWVYPVINVFIREKIFQNKEFNALDDIKHLRDYLAEHLDSGKTKDDLKAIPDSLLDQWLDSACKAFTLALGTDFIIPSMSEERETIVKGKKKTNKYRKAVPLDKQNIMMTETTLCFGVQQHLHKRLEEELKDNPKYKDEKGNAIPFSCDREINYNDTQNIYSRLKGYDKFLGMSGTIGSPRERWETIEKYNPRIMKIPPRVESKVQHLGSSFTKDANYYQKILSTIQQAVRDNKPVMVVCEDMRKSKVLYDYLSGKNYSLLSLDSKNMDEEEIDEEWVKEQISAQKIKLNGPTIIKTSLHRTKIKSVEEEYYANGGSVIYAINHEPDSWEEKKNDNEIKFVYQDKGSVKLKFKINFETVEKNFANKIKSALKNNPGFESFSEKEYRDLISLFQTQNNNVDFKAKFIKESFFLATPSGKCKQLVSQQLIDDEKNRSNEKNSSNVISDFSKACSELFIKTREKTPFSYNMLVPVLSYDIPREVKKYIKEQKIQTEYQQQIREKAGYQRIQHFNAKNCSLKKQEDYDEQKEKVKSIANPATVTITTPMNSRGVDVITTGNGTNRINGIDVGGVSLLVIALGVYTHRQLRQIFGRTARNGEPGETAAIYNMDELIKAYGGDDLNSCSADPEKAIEQIQELMEKEEQITRHYHLLIKTAVNCYEKLFDLLSRQTGETEEQKELKNKIQEAKAEFIKRVELEWERAQEVLDHEGNLPQLYLNKSKGKGQFEKFEKAAQQFRVHAIKEIFSSVKEEYGLKQEVVLPTEKDLDNFYNFTLPDYEKDMPIEKGHDQGAKNSFWQKTMTEVKRFLPVSKKAYKEPKPNADLLETYCNEKNQKDSRPKMQQYIANLRQGIEFIKSLSKSCNKNYLVDASVRNFANKMLNEAQKDVSDQKGYLKAAVEYLPKFFIKSPSLNQFTQLLELFSLAIEEGKPLRSEELENNEGQIYKTATDLIDQIDRQYSPSLNKEEQALFQVIKNFATENAKAQPQNPHERMLQLWKLLERIETYKNRATILGSSVDFISMLGAIKHYVAAIHEQYMRICLPKENSELPLGIKKDYQKDKFVNMVLDFQTKLMKRKQDLESGIFWWLLPNWLTKRGQTLALINQAITTTAGEKVEKFFDANEKTWEDSKTALTNLVDKFCQENKENAMGMSKSIAEIIELPINCWEVVKNIINCIIKAIKWLWTKLLCCCCKATPSPVSTQTVADKCNTYQATIEKINADLQYRSGRSLFKDSRRYNQKVESFQETLKQLQDRIHFYKRLPVTSPTFFESVAKKVELDPKVRQNTSIFAKKGDMRGVTTKEQVDEVTRSTMMSRE